MPIQRLRKQHTNLLPTLEIAHLLLVQWLRDVQTIEENRSIAFGRVPVFLRDDALELTETHAICVCDLWFGENAFTLFNRLPQPAIAHYNGVNHAVGVESKVVLAQDSELARTNDISLLRFELTLKDLHECSLPRSAGTHEAVTLAGRKGCGDGVEQYFGAV